MSTQPDSADFKKRVKNFLETIVEKNTIDVIVPVQRRGSSLLTLFQHEWPRLRDVSILDNEYLTKELVKGKTVLVFDDLVNDGTALRSTVDCIRKLEPSCLKTAALFVSCKSRCRPDYHYLMVQEKDLTNAANTFSDYLSSLNAPLDTDHLILEGRLEKNIPPENIATTLTTLGTMYYPQEAERNVISFMPLDWVQAKLGEKPRHEIFVELPPFVRNVNPKIRLFLRDRRKMSLIIIADPEVVIPNRKECQYYLHQDCLFRRFAKERHRNLEVLCVDCSRIRCSIQLAMWFIRAFRRRLNEELNADFSLNKIIWTSMEQRYGNLQSLNKALRTASKIG